MNANELEEILEKHKKWFEGQDGGERAILRNVNLRNVDLRNADLRNADLTDANLDYADLTNANLGSANLTGVHLIGSCLRGANLRYANLSFARLNKADLGYAKLHETNLYHAALAEAKNVPFVPMACPDSGSFVAWKKASGHIVKLLVPEDARRSSSTGRKCRCDKAIVLAIETMDGKPSEFDEIASSYDCSFIYKVGEIITEPDFCEDRFRECAEGIHFFINRQEAVEYVV